MVSAVNVFNTLVVNHTFAFIGTQSGTVQSLLLIQQSFTPTLKTLEAFEHEINIGHFITYRNGFALESSDELVIDSESDVHYNYSIDSESLVTIEQEFTINPSEINQDSFLQISHEFGVNIIPSPYCVFESILDIEQDFEVIQDHSMSFENVLVITHNMCGGYTTNSPSLQCPETVLYPNAGIVKQYDLVLVNTVTLESMTLPRPLFTNREIINVRLIDRKTLSGDPKVFKDANWKNIRVHRYKFDDLESTAITNMFVFLSNSLGILVELTDHEGHVWEGYLTNPQGESGQFLRMCGHTTEFDFEVA